MLAYCLEHRAGIAFSRGLAEPNEPAVSVRNLSGALLVWIEIGNPDAARLHKASKAAPRVVIYTHENPLQLLRQLDGERVHRRETIEIRAVDRGLLEGLTGHLEKRMKFGLNVSDGHVYATFTDGSTADGAIERLSLG